MHLCVPSESPSFILLQKVTLEKKKKLSMKIFLLAVVPCFQLVERMVRGGEGTQEDEQLLKEAALNVSPN